jgi:RNA polymerase sigma-70 factor (ECF subfamily)
MSVMRASAGNAPDTTTHDARLGPDTTLAEIEAARRDPDAAATIYAAWFDPVYRYCYRRLGSPEAAEDATSRVFERVLRALPDYRPDETRPGATFRSWLFAIAHNTIVDHHRRRRFHLSLDRLLHPRGEKPPLHLPDSGRPPDELAIGRDTDRAVREALTHLPERQRRVVELRLAGLTGPEIATALDTTHQAVKSAQFRAYQTLRETLTALGYAPEDDR